MHNTFRELLAEMQKKTRTSLVICSSMLIAGIILLAFKHMVGWLFLCMGIGLGYSLYSKNNRTGIELAKISDMNSFCKEFDSEDAQRFELLGLTLTSGYAVLELPYLQIIPLEGMDKFEVGLHGDIRKALFLTDRNGTRHKIAETQKGDALQEEFDKAYEAVRAYFNSRSNTGE